MTDDELHREMFEEVIWKNSTLEDTLQSLREYLDSLWDRGILLGKEGIGYALEVKDHRTIVISLRNTKTIKLRTLVLDLDIGEPRELPRVNLKEVDGKLVPEEPIKLPDDVEVKLILKEE